MLRARRWTRVRDAACLVLVMVAGAAAQDRGFGSVTFPTSGAAAARPRFLEGVAALHCFEYEEANAAFRQAQTIDADFAMAYWGEAMTYSQTLWGNEDLEAGRETLGRLRRRLGGRRTSLMAKERALIDAVEALFGDGDAPTRHRSYAEAMGRVHALVPDDPDVASFYALALLGTMSRSLIGFSDPDDVRNPMLAGSETQKQVGAILGKVLDAHPGHPGALHYLLHNYDDPQHARQALDAARAYARAAPESSHALHMPAHIFFQLGMWHEAAASDRAAFDSSSRWVAARGLPLTMRNYHALSWLQYELLQLGRYEEARATVDEIEPVVKAGAVLRLLSNLSSMRARYVIETRRWSMLARERNFGNVNDLFAIGVSAARMGDTATAAKARQALADRSQRPEEGDLRPAIAIMERELAALIELAEGRRDPAIEMLRAAARDELQLPPPLGLPAPIKPAPELLGEILLELGRPREAQQPFEQALARNPGRTLSLLGLARAAAALGDTTEARRHYGSVLRNLDRADPDLPELAEARAAVAGPGEGDRRSRTRAALSVLAGAVVLAALWARRRHRARKPSEAAIRHDAGRQGRGAPSRGPTRPKRRM